LLQTWHPRTRPQSLDLTQAVKWVDLTVLRTEAGGPADSEAVVEFVARFKDNGRMCRLHEASRFIKEGDRWYYVAGT
jgi:SEC-C motif-containing protein